MGFFVCDLSYCKKSSRGFLGWPRRAAAHAAWTWRSSARLPSRHCPATVCLLYMMYKCECLLGWWVEDAPRLFCQKTSLLRARKMMIIFISSRVMLKFVYRSWKQNDFFISHQLNWYNHHNQRSFIILLLNSYWKFEQIFAIFENSRGLPTGILVCPKIAKRHLIWCSQPAPQNKHKTN